MIKLSKEEICCKDCDKIGCPINKYLSDDWLKKISDLKQTSIYRKDQYIVHEGNKVLGLYFIQKGKVKVLSFGLGGKTQIVRLTKHGDIIGHRGYGGETYPISAVTIEESTVCFIDNDTIYKAFMDNPKLTYSLMMYYSNELRKSESKIKTQTQMNVREKVANALICYNTLFNENNTTTFLINISRQDISDFAGINTEQLSRIISEYKEEGIISVKKNEIQINDLLRLKEVIKPFGIVEQ